jgi:hypothetical protein
MAIVTAENGQPAASDSSVWAISGRPAQIRYCFGRSPPSLRPRPAATTRSATLIDDNWGLPQSLDTLFQPVGGGVNAQAPKRRLDSAPAGADQSRRNPTGNSPCR